jgi:hypothetical protein
VLDARDAGGIRPIRLARRASGAGAEQRRERRRENAATRAEQAARTGAQ